MVAMLTVAPGVAIAVAANGPCEGDSNPNYFAGMGPNFAGAAGAEAKIENIAPLLCIGGSDLQHGSSSWVAIEGATSNRIFQVGMIKCVDNLNPTNCDGALHTFWAWGREAECGGSQARAPVPVKIGVVPAGSPRYTVFKSSTTVFFQVNGTTMETISSSSVCWARVGPGYRAETFDRGDQAGGTVGNHQTFSSAHVEFSVGGVWGSPSFTTCEFTGIASYNCSRTNGQQFDIWTDRS
jgi:hypothetical protein